MIFYGRRLESLFTLTGQIPNWVAVAALLAECFLRQTIFEGSLSLLNVDFRSRF